MTRTLVWLLASAALAAMAVPLLADPRPWTFVEDTYPEGKGRLEYEQFITYATRSAEDHSLSRFDIRHQFEYGVTENFDLSVYVANWIYEDSDERTGTRFHESAIEGIYYFTDPHTDPVGVGVFAEAAFAERGFDLKNKLIIHKDFGPWAISYNLMVHTEFENAYNAEEDEDAQTCGAIGHAFGVSRALDHHWRIGGECTVETTYPGWSEYGDTTVYAGPDASFVQHFRESDNEFWITVTPMFQLSDVEEEPDVVVRLIATWLF